MNWNKLTKKKSRKERFDLLVAMIILLLSFLPFIHDFNLFQEKEGFSGFPSLRISIWVISMFVLSISGWIFAFIEAKGKKYRFVTLSPISMLVYQLIIYVIDKRDSSVNDFNMKVVANFVFLAIIVLMYFKLKNNEQSN